jgi:hypothetical protein
MPPRRLYVFLGIDLYIVGPGRKLHFFWPASSLGLGASAAPGLVESKYSRT